MSSRIRQSVLAQGAPAKTLIARTCWRFGAPIHLYPAQCDEAWPACRIAAPLQERDSIRRAGKRRLFAAIVGPLLARENHQERKAENA